MFAGGLLIGVALAAWWFGGRDDRTPPQALAPAAAPAEPTAAPAAAPQPGPVAVQSVPVQPPPPALAAVAPVSCTFAPLLARGGARDGQFALQPVRAGQQLSEASAYAAVADEVRSEGRPRDAEVALIMSCRVAGLAAGTTSPQLADAMVELAQHYADAARDASTASAVPGASAEALLRRAEDLLRQGVQVYAASFGRDDRRTREAGARLEQLQQAIAAAGAAQQVASPAESQASTSAMGAASESPSAQQARAPEVPVPAHSSSPSFDCERARSASERLICSDPQLAQLDNNLGRLRAQARNVTGDPAGFRRRDEQAWLQRESECQDKACLLRWYETRRRQLLREFGG